MIHHFVEFSMQCRTSSIPDLQLWRSHPLCHDHNQSPPHAVSQTSSTMVLPRSQEAHLHPLNGFSHATVLCIEEDSMSSCGLKEELKKYWTQMQSNGTVPTLFQNQFDMEFDSDKWGRPNRDVCVWIPRPSEYFMLCGKAELWLQIEFKLLINSP